jgi:hypothetical protein
MYWCSFNVSFFFIVRQVLLNVLAISEKKLSKKDWFSFKNPLLKYFPLVEKCKFDALYTELMRPNLPKRPLCHFNDKLWWISQELACSFRYTSWLTAKPLLKKTGLLMVSHTNIFCESLEFVTNLTVLRVRCPVDL